MARALLLTPGVVGALSPPGASLTPGGVGALSTWPSLTPACPALLLTRVSVSLLVALHGLEHHSYLCNPHAHVHYR